MKYIVMIQNYWGRGDSPLEAANTARKIGGLRKKKTMPTPRVVFSYDPKKTSKAYIDDMGSLCWNGERPAMVEKVALRSIAS